MQDHKFMYVKYGLYVLEVCMYVCTGSIYVCIYMYVYICMNTDGTIKTLSLCVYACDFALPMQVH